MKQRYYVCLFFLNCIILFSTVYGDDSNTDSRPSFFISKIEKPFEINGRVNNPAWLNAHQVELKYEIEPGDNTPAPQRTIVKALYVDQYLYVGFICFDSNPEEIRANMSERDKIFNDDFVLIALDTYGDYQKAYELVLNPFGIQGDLLATQNGEDASVDIIWNGAAAVNDSGWTAEFAVPFRSINFPDADEQNWAINIVRTIPRVSRTQISWVPIDRNIPSFLSQAGWVKGINNIRAGGSVEILPYAIGQQLGSLNDYDNPNAGFNYGAVTGRIGGGIKYSPGPDFSLDGVINPDFSQIESDADQISVNTTFALYYEEKRPFFLIGRELLETPMYYSRSINNPLGAARIIGKKGALSYMFLGAYDRNTVIDIPGEEQSNTVATDIKSFANIGKLRYDFGDEDYIGSLVMSRNMDGGHNYLVGFDWNYKFWSNWYFSGEGFLSHTKEINNSTLLDSADAVRKFGETQYDAGLNGERYFGNGLHLVLSHAQKTYQFVFVSNTFSPTYQTYNGLFSSNGFNEFYLSNTYILYPEDSFLERGRFSLNTSLEFFYNGDKKNFEIEPAICSQWKGQTHLDASYSLVNNESFLGKEFKNVNRFFFFLNTKPIKEISFSVDGNIGRFVRRSSNPSVGTGHNLGASITLLPTSQFNLSFSYNRARLSNKETGELFYDGNIYRAVAVYQFSAEAFFRTIVQYNSFGKTFKIYPLFSYKLDAFTTFYAGATSDYLDYKDEFGIRNTDQQFFLKIQYLLGM